MIKKIKLINDQEKNDVLNAKIHSNNMNLTQEQAEGLLKDFVNCFDRNRYHIYAYYDEGFIQGLAVCSLRDRRHLGKNENNAFLKITERIDECFSKVGLDPDIIVNFINCTGKVNCDVCAKILQAIEWDLNNNGVDRICFYTSNPEWFSWAYDGGFELLNSIEVDFTDIPEVKMHKKRNLRMFARKI